MHWTLWALLGIIGTILYINIGHCTYKSLKEVEPKDNGCEFLVGVFWPVMWLIIAPTYFTCRGVARGFKKIFPNAKLRDLLFLHKLPDCHRAWREGRRAKKAANAQKFLEAHQVDPLQAELRELAETRRQRQGKERELMDLKRKEEELEAAQERHYREPARVPEREAPSPSSVPSYLDVGGGKESN